MSNLSSSSSKNSSTWPPHVIAAIALAVLVVLTAVALSAPGFALLAVPFAVGAQISRRLPRAGAVVIATAAALVLTLVALAVSQGRPESWQDLTFDVVGGLLAAAALFDGVRSLSGRFGHREPPMRSLADR